MRILFVGMLRIGEDNATGRTLLNLFEGFNDISVFQYCLNPRFQKTPTLYPTTYLLKKESPLNYFLYTKYGGAGTDSTAKKQAEKSTTKSFYKEKLVRFVSNLRDNCKIHISAVTHKKIAEFNPEVIYTLGGSISVIDTAIRLSKQYHIPIIAHTMDDLISRKYVGKGLFTRYLNKKFLRKTIEMYHRSVCGIAIGEKMATEYSERFHLPFYHAMNCITATHFTPPHENDTLKIIFSGGVHGGRDKTLREFALALEQFNNNISKKKVELEVYTNPAGKEKFNDLSLSSFSVHDYVSSEVFFDNLSRADILLHVESFDEQDRKYFRLSMSTKLPEYLSVGRPVMVIGPTDVSSVEYIERYGVGVVFHDLSGIDKFFTSVTREKLCSMGEKALILAERNHLRHNVQKEMRTAFERSIQEYNVI